MLNAKLVVVGGGDAKMSEIQLKLPVTIGRSRDVKLKLPHPLVSRNHCEIFEREGKLFVRDLGSLNGTYVDSHKIEREQPLAPNQLLTLGTVTFRAIYEMNSAAQVLESDSGHTDLSDRPTKKAATANRPLAKSAPMPISEVETENDPASDTDASLPGLSEIDFSEIGAAKKEAVDVPSSIFLPNAAPTGASSVSLSEIQKLPGGPSQLSFAGGIQTDMSIEPNPAASPAALPKIITDQVEKVMPDKSGKRRPR